MNPSTTIKDMMGYKIVVPAYQRAYSWDTPEEGSNRNTQTDVFLSDLEKHGDTTSPYYFGHFLFEFKEKEKIYYVIDGQQRLTTIVIFLCTLLKRLESERWQPDFSTVEYDNQLLEDYVIEQTKSNYKKGTTNYNSLETESSRRIVKAFNFFEKKLLDKPEDDLKMLLDTVSKATCTTHRVQNASEAIQMFIFQNSRGKRPSNLEIVKAQFMYQVHLDDNGDKEKWLNKIKNRFEKIYKSISSIEHRINEDDVLLYTLRVYRQSLTESNSLEIIDKKLSNKDDNPIQFILDFTETLAESFKHLKQFFKEDQEQHDEIYSLITLGGIAVALPFIIQAYRHELPPDKICELCAVLENLILRHRLIGTRADISTRLNDVFKTFTDNDDITPIAERINYLKAANSPSEWWWAYWNNNKLEEALQGEINPPVAKYLLWKYEGYLSQESLKSGYSHTRLNDIGNPELEHIAPTTEPKNKPRHWYGTYNDTFKNEYLDCLGNYLLVAKSHNCEVGNKPLKDKLATYEHLKQQREVVRLAKSKKGMKTWGKKIIQKRKEKIIEAIMELYAPTAKQATK